MTIRWDLMFWTLSWHWTKVPKGPRHDWRITSSSFWFETLSALYRCKLYIVINYFGAFWVIFIEGATCCLFVSSLDMFKSNCDEGGAAVHKPQHQWFGVSLSGGTSTFATTHCGSSHRSDGEIHSSLAGKPYGDWKDTWKWQCCKLPSPRWYDSRCIHGNVYKLVNWDSVFSIKWDSLTLVKLSQHFSITESCRMIFRVDTSSCLVQETVIYPLSGNLQSTSLYPDTPGMVVSKSKDLGTAYVVLEFPMALLSILAALWQLFAWSPGQPEVCRGILWPLWEPPRVWF